MKSYTSIKQAKKLAEFLPLESADMRFCFSHTLSGRITGHYPMIGREPSMGTTPCWSLAALLNVLPKQLHTVLAINEKGKYAIGSADMDKYDCLADNPIDATYEMIIKLHEKNLLWKQASVSVVSAASKL